MLKANFNTKPLTIPIGLRRPMGSSIGGAWLSVFAIFFGLNFPASPVLAREFGKAKPGMANETPNELKDVEIISHVGEKIDLDLEFVDQDGRTVKLREYTKNGKPLLLSLAYYACPSLCSFHLNGLNDAFKRMAQPLGEEFNFVVVSFDPNEKPELAALKRKNYLNEYGRAEGAKGWHFLTGKAPAIDALTKSIGFKYQWVEAQKQYAHASAAYAISPDGTLTRYLYGITFEPKTIRLTMIEASKGLVGSVVDRLILYCFHFDPKENKYTVAAMQVMKAGGAMIVVILGSFLLPFWIRNRKESQGDV